MASSLPSSTKTTSTAPGSSAAASRRATQAAIRRSSRNMGTTIERVKRGASSSTTVRCAPWRPRPRMRSEKNTARPRSRCQYKLSRPRVPDRAPASRDTWPADITFRLADSRGRVWSVTTAASMPNWRSGSGVRVPRPPERIGPSQTEGGLPCVGGPGTVTRSGRTHLVRNGVSLQKVTCALHPAREHRSWCRVAPVPAPPHPPKAAAAPRYDSVARAEALGPGGSAARGGSGQGERQVGGPHSRGRGPGGAGGRGRGGACRGVARHAGGHAHVPHAGRPPGRTAPVPGRRGVPDGGGPWAGVVLRRRRPSVPPRRPRPAGSASRTSSTRCWRCT